MSTKLARHLSDGNWLQIQPDACPQPTMQGLAGLQFVQISCASHTSLGDANHCHTCMNSSVVTGVRHVDPECAAAREFYSAPLEGPDVAPD